MASNKDSKNGAAEMKPAVIESAPIVQSPPPPPPPPTAEDNPPKMTVAQQLADPFHPTWLRAKPQVVKPGRALAVSYITAREVQLRLDNVVGPENWQDEYTVISQTGAGKDLSIQVKCRLSVRINDTWIAKEDVGSEGDVGDEGDKMKGAFSDALKRAAVKFGIGRYLYFLPPLWCDYDNDKKEFVSLPELPKWALPAAMVPIQAPAIGTGDVGNMNSDEKPKDEVPQPKNGKELRARLIEFEKRNGKRFKTGEVLSWVAAMARQGGYETAMETWGVEEIAFVAELKPWMSRAVEKNHALPTRSQDCADTIAAKLQEVIEQEGREYFGRGWGKWLADQGVVRETELSTFSYRILGQLQKSLRDQVAEDRAEREAIQAEGATKKG